MNDTATPTRAGTMGDDHELVAVTFNSSPKHYYYWVPREWTVHVGDQLLVCTPSTPRAVVRIVERGRPLDKTGEFHKKAVTEVDIELLRPLDDQVMECEGCGWWCETSDLNDEQVCSDCAPDEDDDE